MREGLPRNVEGWFLGQKIEMRQLLWVSVIFTGGLPSAVVGITIAHSLSLVRICIIS